jgi:putative oxidoreductase
MKRLFSTKHSAGAINTALFLLRIVAGALMLKHGYDKLSHFDTLHSKFMNFMGIGSTASLVLAIFSEFFCSLLLILGLFTRLACIPLIISISVALFKIHDADFFGKGEVDSLFLISFIVILLIGPGKASVDKLIGK